MMKKALFLLSFIVIFSFAQESSFYDENGKYLVKFAKAKKQINYIPPTNPKIEIFLRVNDKNRSIYEVQNGYKELITYNAAWNKNRLFLHYSYEDKSGKKYWDNGGVFDTKTSSMICKDGFKINGNLRDIGWINEKTLYILGDERLYHFAIEEDECIKVGSDKHGIKDFKKVDKSEIKGDILVVYKDKESEKIEIKLKVITENTIKINKLLSKINKLIKASFEKRALKTIDKLIDTQYKNLNAYYGFEINGISYNSYFLVRYIKRHKNFDGNLYESFRIYMTYAYFGGYYKQANEMIKYMKSLKIPQKKFKDLITLSEALYLLSIGKDEGYDILFDMQPISKKLKRNMNGFTLFTTPFGKEIGKLAVALDMKESEFGKNSSTVDEFFIFDIDGNKIEKKEKKVAPKESKKSNAIKLLD